MQCGSEDALSLLYILRRRE